MIITLKNVPWCQTLFIRNILSVEENKQLQVDSYYWSMETPTEFSAISEYYQLLLQRIVSIINSNEELCIHEHESVRFAPSGLRSDVTVTLDVDTLDNFKKTELLVFVKQYGDTETYRSLFGINTVYVKYQKNESFKVELSMEQAMHLVEQFDCAIKPVNYTVRQFLPKLFECRLGEVTYDALNDLYDELWSLYHPSTKTKDMMVSMPRVTPISFNLELTSNDCGHKDQLLQKLKSMKAI